MEPFGKVGAGLPLQLSSSIFSPGSIFVKISRIIIFKKTLNEEVLFLDPVPSQRIIDLFETVSVRNLTSVKLL